MPPLAPRLAALVVPLFPLAARLRAEPALAGEAIAIVEGNGGGARLVAASRPARRAGVRTGTTLAQARSLLPRLVARPRDRECERSAREALAEMAERFSPRVECAGDGLVFLDTTGLERHHAGDDPEQNLARELIRASEAITLPARVGIASSRLAARVAAEGAADGPIVVPVGREATFLAPLPLGRLAPEIEIAETLARWGLHAIGELARLPEAEIAGRLGPLGRELHAAACGHDPHPLVPRHPPPEFREGTDLEWPLVSLEPFLAFVRTALDRLATRLGAHGLSATRLVLELVLEPDGLDVRPLELPAPTRDAATLLSLLRLSLEGRPPGAPVTAFAVSAHPDRPRRAQLTLFGPPALSPDRLAETLARLASLLGSDRVGSPRPVDSHRPEAWALAPCDPPPPPAQRRPPRRGRGLLAARALRPAVELEVIVDEPPASPVALPVALHEVAAPSGDGAPLPSAALSPEVDPPPARPAALRALPAPNNETHRPALDGRIRVASGPWTTEEGWWSEAVVDRDYWDVELESGWLGRIYRDRATGRWFADGIYD